MVVLSGPATVVGRITGSTDIGGVVYALELVAVTVVAVPVLISQWRSLRETGAGHRNPLILGYATAYLVVMAVLWVAALPAYFGAVDGVTADGDPIGSLWYTLVCFAIAGLCLAACRSVAPRAQTTPEPLLTGR